ncbi:hypothetical protein LROSL1_1298 [Furfurilactobacillus rossiae]|uniref:DUF4432 family protein n=1 Tax=Furfurilactobacillus rossiae TaxID=231049 RepID=UPI0015B852D8|nr:DUF4432 family protein [Furfurilactobacillus rossiae]MCF6165042.1 DUF4432 family protein [Furfurilactobacillus rossiae]QLE64115.1 hypothetical protein LROSL1_1298 [Furfurilactobacillus rossiae]
MTKFRLYRDSFKEQPRVLIENDEFTISSFKYSSGVEALKVRNSRGYLTFLPFEGLMIWEAVFDGLDLKMKNTFKQPYPGKQITDSYGSFQFHSGLLASGNPGPEDDHYAHGEFPLTPMDSSFVYVDEDTVTISSQVEYVKGFGDHYFANPSVTLKKGSALFDIKMFVKNLSECQEMPLQYLTHINYKFVKGAKITQNIPDRAFELRTSIPDHIHPTKEWLAFTDKVAKSGELINELDDPNHFDPEIVFFGDKLNEFVDDAVFEMTMDEKHTVKVAFNTKQFPDVTRWLMANPDLQVAAFALPATSRTEGRTAAKKKGTLIMLKPQESRSFKVTTGLED